MVSAFLIICEFSMLTIERDPTQASAFIIPYDGGVHSYIDHRNGFPRLASPHG